MSRVAQKSLFLVLTLVLCACAEGVEPPDREDSGPPTGDAADCNPACDSNEMCINGRCVSGETDMDNDGVPAAMDCDDSNRNVGRAAQRACTGVCGAGVEMCDSGVWTACDAPTQCDCSEEDATRSQPCGMCGTQRQVCSGGSWLEDGACSGEGECMPGQAMDGECGARRTCGADCKWGLFSGGGGSCTQGATETRTQPCGSCGGQQMQMRTCDASCNFGNWTNVGACSAGPGECTPGQTDTRQVACPGGCGMRTDTRSCGSSSCMWGAWQQGTCAGSACTPGQTSACANGDSCGHRVCSSACEWGPCVPRTGAQCLRIRPGQTGEGTNYQCCGTDRWQFCLSSCNWAACAQDAGSVNAC